MASMNGKSRCELSQWYIRPAYPGTQSKEVIVQGFKFSDDLVSKQLWHSSIIVKRIKGNELETGSGSRYLLIGKQDVRASIENGIDEKVAVLFEDGFPKCWKKILEEEKTQTNKKVEYQEEVDNEIFFENEDIDDESDDFIPENDFIDDDDEDDSSSLTTMASRRRNFNKKKPEKSKTKNNNKKKTKCKEEEEDDDEKEENIVISTDKQNNSDQRSKDNAEWSVEENRLLRKAHAIADPDPKRFWKHVASMIPGRSAKDCSQHWFHTFLEAEQVFLKRQEQREEQQKAKRRKKNKDGFMGNKPAGKHTAKFRKQVREMLKESENDQNDDLFHSTPFKSKKNLNDDNSLGIQTPGGDSKVSSSSSSSPIISDDDDEDLKKKRDQVDREKTDLYIAKIARNKTSKIISSNKNIKNKENIKNGVFGNLDGNKKIKTMQVLVKTKGGVLTPGGSVKVKTVTASQLNYAFSDDEDECSDDEF